jgi:transcriptional regulator with XRE-family HTH domain
MTSTAIDLGDVLRRLRRRADLSQRQLALRAGIPQPTVARIESGRAADPRFRTVERLVRAAGGELLIELAGDPDGTSARGATANRASADQASAERVGGERGGADRALPTPVPHDGLRASCRMGSWSVSCGRTSGPNAVGWASAVGWSGRFSTSWGGRGSARCTPWPSTRGSTSCSPAASSPAGSGRQL